MVIQASSHQVPVGVSTDSKPSCSAVRAMLPRYSIEADLTLLAVGPRAKCESSPDPTISRLSPFVGRYQCRLMLIPRWWLARDTPRRHKRSLI